MHFIFLCSLLAANVLQSIHVEGMALVPRERHQEEIANQALHFLKNDDDICESHRNYRQAGVDEAIQVQEDTPSGASDRLNIIIHHHKPLAGEETSEEVTKRSTAASEANEHLSKYLEKKMDSVESSDKNPKTRSYLESVLHHHKGNRYDSPSNGNLEIFLGSTSNADSSEDSGHAGREWQYQEFGNPKANGFQDSRSRIYSQNRQSPLEQRYRPIQPEYRADGDVSRYRPRVVYPDSRFESQEESGYRAPDTKRDEYVPKRKSRYRNDGEEVEGGDYKSERRSGYKTRDEEERTDAYVPKRKSGYRTRDSSEEEKGYEERKKSGYRRYENRGKKPSSYDSQDKSGYKNRGRYKNKEEKRDNGSKEEGDNYGKQEDKSSSEENPKEDVLVKVSVNNDQDSPDVGKVKIDVKKDRDLYPDERQLKISVKKDKYLLPAVDRDIKIEIRKDSEQVKDEDEEDDRTIVKLQKPKRKCCKKRKSKSSRMSRY